tara:strand:- start:89 stop:307 length:219 start_codon:yes stop_codon:yes gene_type:complete
MDSACSIGMASSDHQTKETVMDKPQIYHRKGYQIIERDKGWFVYTDDHPEAGPFKSRREAEEAADLLPPEGE